MTTRLALVSLGLLISSSLLLAACGQHEDRSICTVYGRYLVAVDPIRYADPATAVASDAIAAAERAQRAVQGLSSVELGNAAEPVRDIGAALSDLLHTLRATRSETELTSLEPLVADDLAAAADADVRLRAVLGPKCALALDAET